jgi:AcrR family transcriptional regulator
MARTLDPEAYATKRDAFIDAGARLIETKGYEQVSIQDLLDELGISKGAFYHYFGSKGDLLEAIVERMADAVEAQWADPMTRPGLSAAERLESVFAIAAQWKSARRDLVMAVIEAWLSDHNAIVREKLGQIVARRMTGLLETVLRQGVADGDFTVTDPESTAHVLVGLIQTAQERALALFVARQDGSVEFADVERSFDAFQEAFERIVGAPPESIHFVSHDTLELWFN